MCGRAPKPRIARPAHPDTAAERGIAAGDWVAIETLEGSVRARARFNASVDPRVVVGQGGWCQACAELDLPGYDPFSAQGSNFNLLIGAAALDPVSGTPSHRSNLCEIRLAAADPPSMNPREIAGAKTASPAP